MHHNRTKNYNENRCTFRIHMFFSFESPTRVSEFTELKLAPTNYEAQTRCASYQTSISKKRPSIMPDPLVTLVCSNIIQVTEFAVSSGTTRGVIIPQKQQQHVLASPVRPLFQAVPTQVVC